MLYEKDPLKSFNLLYIYNNVILNNHILKNFHDTSKITNKLISNCDLKFANNSLIGNLLNVDVNDLKFKESYYDLPKDFKSQE